MEAMRRRPDGRERGEDRASCLGPVRGATMTGCTTPGQSPASGAAARQSPLGPTPILLMTVASIPEILEDLRAGRMVILVDDPSRENEGDLAMLAEHASAEAINFMACEARGLVCMPLSGEICDRLGLRQQVDTNTSRQGTAFTISVDAASGVSTGISAADRARTIR